MTDFDLFSSPGAPAGLQERLSQAIFGGPALSQTDRNWLDRFLRTYVGSGPLQVIAAVREDSEELPWLAGALVLKLHAGLTYLTHADVKLLQAASASRSTPRSAPQVAPTSAHWIVALQHAIVDLRHRELSVLGDDPTAATPDLKSEIEARRLALSHLQRQDPQWRPACRLWLLIVMKRHQRILNEVRRKIIELFCSLCQRIDESSSLSFAFQQAVERTFRTHLFGQMHPALEQSLEELLLHIPSQLPAPRAADRRVHEAVAYLRDHFAESIRLEDVAEVVHVSPSHLARRFREATGMTLLTFLHRLRIARARQLLAETEQSVLEVALACGYESVEHFHRMFKRETGQTPRRYRVHLQGSE